MRAELERLTDPAELALLRQLALYPRMVEAAAVGTRAAPNRFLSL